MTIVVDNPKLEQDIPIDRIHPDPWQPRIEPDAELADSIKSQGILQAIRVEVIDAGNSAERICPDCGKLFIDLEAEGGHFMLQDGERRLRGSIRAGATTILAKVVPPVAEAKRLIQQLTANTGKPLTPVEEAFAYKRLMDSEGWSQAELARQICRPRSVVGDRVRLVELDPVWLNLIAKGKLQVSHGPQLHLYAAVPAKYQAEAAKEIAEEIDDDPDGFSIEDFDWRVKSAFREFITPLADVSPQYKGPIVDLASYYGGSKMRYAADPDLWKPIAADKAKRAKQNAPKQTASHTASPSNEQPITKAKKALAAAGYSVPSRDGGGVYPVKLKAGEFAIYETNGWAAGIDPATFLEKLDPTKLTIVAGYHGVIASTDADAVKEAQAAFAKHVDAVAKKELAPLRAKLTDEVLAAHAVKGPGVAQLVSYLRPQHGTPKVVALALGLSIAGAIDDDDMYDDDPTPVLAAGSSHADAERLLAAIAAVTDLKLKVPDNWTIENKIRQSVGSPAFRVPKAAPAAKSKTQEKREARAAGKQVGDPSRAKKEKQVPIAKGSDTLRDQLIGLADEVDADERLEEAHA